MQYRHGDLLLIKVEEVPQGAKRTRGKILAEGEATGHAHRLEGPGTLYLKDGQLTLRNTKPTAVVHEEHARIDLPPGTYEVRRQREYQPGELPRQVVD